MYVQPCSCFSIISAIIILIIPTITSLLLFKNEGDVNLKIFIFHVLISAIILSFLQISMFFVNYQDLNSLENSLTNNITVFILITLIIEQTLFGIYIFREIKKLTTK